MNWIIEFSYILAREVCLWAFVNFSTYVGLIEFSYSLAHKSSN